MVMLEAAMAFAIAMIIFSTITTGIIELLQRLSRVRSKKLRLMTAELFDNYIWQRLQLHFALESDAGQAKLDLREKFIADMTRNPMAKSSEQEIAAKSDKKESVCSEWDNGHDRPVGGVKKKLASLCSKIGNWYRRPFGSEIEKLTPLSFAERLARTEVGKAILAEDDKYLEDIINDFTRSFDRLGRTATEFMDSRARTFSIIVGIVLALVVNIDAGRLITTLIKNPDLRTELISQAETFAEEQQKAVTDLQNVVAAGEIEALGEPQVKEITDAIATIRKKLNNHQAQGLPIGYEYFPYGPKGTPYEICQEIEGVVCNNGVDNLGRALAIIVWIVKCIIAGVLIGLGGPFWYKVFTRLSQIMQLFRALGIGANKTASETAKQVTAPEDSAKPESVIDAFKVAANNHNYPQNPKDRAVLGPDGTPV